MCAGRPSTTRQPRVLPSTPRPQSPTRRMMTARIPVSRPHRQRQLARTALLGAVVLALVSFPYRATWWGGWILAVAEAGIVGGLADWFAVTAIFRYPMGIPIPHTALIPTNWEVMAARVGAMV